MKKTICITGLGFLLFATLNVCGQNRHDKTIVIINKLEFVEIQKANFEFQLETLKYQASGNDSIRLGELEEQLTKEEVLKRINAAFDEIFSDEEINDIYNFIQTSAFEKFIDSEKTYKVISAHFSDIDKEIEEITNNLDSSIEEPANKPNPTLVDKEDGFYATIDFTSFTKDVKLEDNPSLTFEYISKVKKTYQSPGTHPEIHITLNKKGAQEFYQLTKANIGKPIAIVIDNQIVTMPFVHSEIEGGKVVITGNFSEKEIDNMIEKLKEK